MIVYINNKSASYLFIGITQKLRSISAKTWVEPPKEDLSSFVHHEIDPPLNQGLRLYKPRSYALRAPKTGASKGSQNGTGRDLGSNQP
jgi:hypothetical protein